MKYNLINGFLDLVYPPICLICKKSLKNDSHASFTNFRKDILCPECFKKITMNFPPFCPKCSRHLNDVTRVKCKPCTQHKHHFDFAWSACLYQGAAKDFLRDFKYEQKTVFRHMFSHLLINFIQKYHLDIEQFHLIIPVPLHKTRLRERGYNQSELMAKLLGKQYEINLSKNNLIRKTYTQPQSTLSEKERWTNIKGAFKIKNSREVSDKNVLLLDDLLTTGATTSEAAYILKKAGANRVGVLTLAVTV